MGLHQAINTRWTTITIWYQAVNERGGRWHLWDVPAYVFDKTLVRLHQEEGFSYSRDDLISRWNMLGWSEFLDTAPPPNARRLCATNQRVYRWSRRWGWSGLNTPRAEPTPPRGWCRACWPSYVGRYAEIRRNSEQMANWSNRVRGSGMTLTQQGNEWQAQVDAR